MCKDFTHELNLNFHAIEDPWDLESALSTVRKANLWHGIEVYCLFAL